MTLSLQQVLQRLDRIEATPTAREVPTMRCLARCRMLAHQLAVWNIQPDQVSALPEGGVAFHYPGRTLEVLNDTRHILHAGAARYMEPSAARLRRELVCPMPDSPPTSLTRTSKRSTT